jgi:multidrug efflux system membrane fusion protein
MFKRFLIVAILLALVGAGLVGFDMFRKKMMGQVFAAMAVPPPAPVATTEAKSQAVPRRAEGVGSLEAISQVTITAEVGGKVTAIAFEPGSDVESGALLISLNDAPERADLARYQAQANLAALNLGRAQKLLKLATPQSRVDEFKSQQAEAQSAVRQVEAVIEQKQIKAPFSGTLGIRQVDLGEFINPGDPIVTLTDLSKLYVNFSLPEQVKSQIAVGQDVQLSTDSYKDTKFLAKITAIDPVINPETRTISVQATMDNPDNQLSPGMYVQAAVQLPDAAPAIIIPETAVEFSIYGDSVYAVRELTDEDKAEMAKAPTMPGAPPADPAMAEKIRKVEKVYVTAGDRFDGKVAITEGLKEGDTVVTSGQVNLSDSAKVLPTEKDTLANQADNAKKLY